MKQVQVYERSIADLKTKGLALIDTADKEKRALTAEEQKQSDDIMAEIKSLQSKVESRKALLNITTTTPEVTIEVKQPEKFRSIGEQLIAVREWQLGIRQDNRLIESRAVSGMNEAIPSEGGFLVQTDFSSQLLEKTFAESPILSRVWKMPVSSNSNSIKIPYISETRRTNSYRQGGILAYWEPEAGSPTATKTTLGKLSLELKKLTGLCYLTEELLADAPALSSWVGKAFKQEFDFRIVDAIVNGDGAGKPLGIMNAPCLVTVTAETGQGASTIVADNVIKMYARRFGPNTGNYVWLINQDIEPQLHTMSLVIGSGGVPVYMPAGGWNNGLYATLFGRPVISCEQCATLGTNGDIILADLSQYILIDKGNMQSATSIHVKFVEGETAFRFVYRVDGAPWWQSSLTPYKGSNAQSPFVCLNSTRT